MNRRSFFKWVAFVLAMFGLPKVSFAKVGTQNTSANITQDDISRIKNCQKAIEKYRNGKSYKSEDLRTAATFEMNQVLKDNGFVNNKGEGSAAVFRVWYEPLLLKLYIDCNPVSGVCSGCAGLPEKACGRNSCMNAGDSFTESAYAFQLESRRRDAVNKALRKINGSKFTGLCPNGELYIVEANRIKPPDGIDFDWRP